jgi:hypothetical protein
MYLVLSREIYFLKNDYIVIFLKILIERHVYRFNQMIKRVEFGNNIDIKIRSRLNFYFSHKNKR